ncbi:hypothetical protein Ae201684_009222 [Aphanomyces euteiches]|uniref:Uncharacterized protein n=1 Tax=Aphanomyces euteiches TaxID=100861 RepID=A0A6G0X2C5_9STRA|nr:hypothetical protein Ae201684_009222 [Aphanomyces euteiches]
MASHFRKSSIFSQFTHLLQLNHAHFSNHGVIASSSIFCCVLALAGGASEDNGGTEESIVKNLSLQNDQISFASIVIALTETPNSVDAIWDLVVCMDGPSIQATHDKAMTRKCIM